MFLGDFDERKVLFAIIIVELQGKVADAKPREKDNIWLMLLFA